MLAQASMMKTCERDGEKEEEESVELGGKRGSEKDVGGREVEVKGETKRTKVTETAMIIDRSSGEGQVSAIQACESDKESQEVVS